VVVDPTPVFLCRDQASCPEDLQVAGDIVLTLFLGVHELADAHRRLVDKEQSHDAQPRLVSNLSRSGAPTLQAWL